MPTILLGSIGSLADTSELQREAFNRAFVQHGLDWHWSQDQYSDLLRHSGGQKRIESYAQERGQTVNSAAIHQSKSHLFQQLLQEMQPSPRPGVLEVIRSAKQNSVRLALVTTTSRENVRVLLESISEVSADDFDLIVSRADIKNPKPAPDAYDYALKQLNQDKSRCVAIEDNVDGLAAALAAGLPCIAMPSENNKRHDFSAATLQTARLTDKLLNQFILAPAIEPGSRV